MWWAAGEIQVAPVRTNVGCIWEYKTISEHLWQIVLDDPEASDGISFVSVGEGVWVCDIFVADKPAESGVADQHPLKNFKLKILELPQELYPSV